MCRFLLVKAATPLEPAALLQAFADMAQQSVGSGDTWQGDGWGVAWHMEGAGWQVHKSLQPIWTEQMHFATLPASRLFAVHARSASFPQHKDLLAYNQPYHNQQYAFVFNGLLRGVKVPQRLAGSIGAQKIWSLLQQYLTTAPPIAALTRLRETLIIHSQAVKALNIGLLDQSGGYAFCSFTTNPAYYTLHIHRSPTVQMICSEPLPGYAFTPVESNQVVTVV